MPTLEIFMICSASGRCSSVRRSSVSCGNRRSLLMAESLRSSAHEAPQAAATTRVATWAIRIFMSVSDLADKGLRRLRVRGRYLSSSPDVHSRDAEHRSEETIATFNPAPQLAAQPAAGTPEPRSPSATTPGKPTTCPTTCGLRRGPDGKRRGTLPRVKENYGRQ